MLFDNNKEIQEKMNINEIQKETMVVIEEIDMMMKQQVLFHLYDTLNINNFFHEFQIF